VYVCVLEGVYRKEGVCESAKVREIEMQPKGDHPVKKKIQFICLFFCSTVRQNVITYLKVNLLKTDLICLAWHLFHHFSYVSYFSACFFDSLFINLLFV